MKHNPVPVTKFWTADRLHLDARAEQPSHNPALNTKNVRSACSKLHFSILPTGNAKAMDARERKGRKTVYAVVRLVGVDLRNHLQYNPVSPAEVPAWNIY